MGKIDRDTQIWIWSAKKFHGVGVSGSEKFDITTHPDIFMTLDAPVVPWGESGSGKGLPWVSALTFAIDKCGAKEMTNKEEGIKKITQFLHNYYEYPIQDGIS